MKKVCKKCNIEKEFDEFGNSKRNKYGLKVVCKTCTKEASKQYRIENKDKIREYKKEYIKNNQDKIVLYKEKNSESIKDYYRKYRINNNDKIKANKKEYYKNNCDKIKDYQNRISVKLSIYRKIYGPNYYEENKEKLKEANKLYRKNNKDKITIINRNYKKHRKNYDPLFKLRENISTLIYNSLKNKGFTKKSRTHEILGCTFNDFMIHLNSNKYDFKYGNYNIDIDHIIPVSSATTEEELIKLNHFSNLQLLPSDYNRNVKSNKQFDIEDFERWLNLQFTSPSSLP